MYADIEFCKNKKIQTFPNYSRHASISSYTFDKIGYFRCIRRVAYCRNAHGIFPYANIILRKESYFYITNAAASTDRMYLIYFDNNTSNCTWGSSMLPFSHEVYWTLFLCGCGNTDQGGVSLGFNRNVAPVRESHYVPDYEMFQLSNTFRLVKSKLQSLAVIKSDIPYTPFTF